MVWEQEVSCQDEGEKKYVENRLENGAISGEDLMQWKIHEIQESNLRKVF